MSSTAGSGLESVLCCPAGEIRTVFAPRVSDVLSDLKDWAADSSRSLRVAAKVFDRLPGPKTLLATSISSLAEISLSLWPDWYGNPEPLAAEEMGAFELEGILTRRAATSAGAQRKLSLSWLKAAIPLCRLGRPPLPRGFHPSVQATQLVLAIAPEDLLLALCVAEAQPPKGRLLGLARIAEWLARKTSARVLVVIPAILASSNELDSINFASLPWPQQDRETEETSSEELHLGVWPVMGRPHPYSPGEQLLARKLAQDEQLAGLFSFNTRVQTCFGNDPLVDLLWQEGRVVVEVDGYKFHSNRQAFSADRRRDYELTVTGYLVLRLPHDEVIDDVELAVDKIRDMVRFRQLHPFTRSDREP